MIPNFEDVIKKGQKQQLVDSQADPQTLVLLMVALYSGLQNYELVWMCPDEIRDLWIKGMNLLFTRDSSDSPVTE